MTVKELIAKLQKCEDLDALVVIQGEELREYSEWTHAWETIEHHIANVVDLGGRVIIEEDKEEFL